MIEQEIIQKWKENTSAFKFVPKEMQDWARKIGAEHNFEFATCDGWDKQIDGYFELSSDLRNEESLRIYRLRPDYQPPKPEPKIVKCEVCIEIYWGEKTLQFRLKTGNLVKWYCLNEAMRYPNFVCYEKANGNKIGIGNIATEIRNGGKVFACFVENE